jgi:hypothetical protein
MVGKRYFTVLAGAAMLSALLLVTIGMLAKQNSSGRSALYAVGSPLTAEEEYSTLHPVYTRCAKKVMLRCVLIEATPCRFDFNYGNE